MLFAPLEGWRDVKITERRTAIDYDIGRAGFGFEQARAISWA
jgi:hypothetical protein